MLLTLCTIHQLPQAFALANSFCRYTASASLPINEVLIGLADDPAQLPAGFVTPYPLLFLRDMLPDDQLTDLSGRYTPVEFVAACKPLFIAEAFSRYPSVDQFIYADPNILFFSDPAPIFQALSSATILLTPHVTRSPATGPTSKKTGHDTQTRPDEKHLQNVGLYSSDFMAFQRSDETHRMLAWWRNRVTSRARIDFCAGLCLDQLWLMHVPVFFRGIAVIKDPGWHVALWNLFERQLHQIETSWYVTDPDGTVQPLRFVNAKGLLNFDEGLFTSLDQRLLIRRSDVGLLMQQYRAALSDQPSVRLAEPGPAYGSQPAPIILRGWRHRAVRLLRNTTRFVEQVQLPHTS